MNPSTQHAAAMDGMTFNTSGLPNGTPLTSMFRGAPITAAMLIDEEQARAIRHLLGDAACIEVTADDDPAISPALRAKNTRAANGPASDLVGIRCGPASQFLVAIGFRSADSLKAFTAANPPLANCPVTRWEHWSVLWFRTDFADTQNIKAGDLVWVSQGIVPLGWLTNGTGDIADVLQQGEPQSISYADIVWPAGLRGVFRLPYLQFLYGSPIIRNGRKTMLNASFWAGWLCDQLEIVFDPRVGAFRQIAATGDADGIIGSAAIKEMIAAFLRAAAAQDPKGFPIHEIRADKIMEIVELMKLTNPITSLTEEEGLHEFFQVGIRSQPGANVTNEELWEAYSRFCKLNKVPAFPKCEFQSLSVAWVRTAFGKTCAHNIVRNGRSKRGYNQLALVPYGEALREGQHDTSPAPGGFTPEKSPGVSAFKRELDQKQDTMDKADGEDWSIDNGQTISPKFCHISS